MDTISGFGKVKDTIKRYEGFSLVCVSIVLFSAIEVLSKIIELESGGISFLTLAFSRFAIGSLTLAFILLLTIGFKNDFPITKTIVKNWKGLAVFGILGIGLTFLFFHWGVMLTNASNAAVIFSINPVFVTVFSAIQLKTGIGRVRIFSLFLAIAGLILVGSGFGVLENVSNITLFWIGNLIMLMSAVIQALVYTLQGKKYIDRIGSHGPLLVLLVGFTIGSLIFLTGAIISGNIQILFHLSTRTWVYLIILGVITSAIGHWLFLKGLKVMEKSEVPRGVTPFYIKPMIAPVLSWVLLGEKLITEPEFLIGTILITLAIIIAQTK